ncbi:hypothetical protein [Serratia sp. OS31]|uniref:hypothetical protein n=1 Tax=Serratia sp. OS31 TaxID=2760844 RepID=UPI001602C492|nr:hypothetical protein [Serratia sp. OS31]MBB1585001.1 hypothetical protein [Serratia sp. OS31]
MKEQLKSMFMTSSAGMLAVSLVVFMAAPDNPKPQPDPKIGQEQCLCVIHMTKGEPIIGMKRKFNQRSN